MIAGNVEPKTYDDALRDAFSLFKRGGILLLDKNQMKALRALFAENSENSQKEVKNPANIVVRDGVSILLTKAFSVRYLSPRPSSPFTSKYLKYLSEKIGCIMAAVSLTWIFGYLFTGDMQKEALYSHVYSIAIMEGAEEIFTYTLTSFKEDEAG